MLKKFVCSLLLALAVTGCAGKSRLATPEDILQEMAGRWKVDIAASLKQESELRDALREKGAKIFCMDYGQIEIVINMQSRTFHWYKPREERNMPFVVVPETPEDTAEREKGIRQVRLAFEETVGSFGYVLRYGNDGRLSLFAHYGLVAVFSRLKE